MLESASKNKQGLSMKIVTLLSQSLIISMLIMNSISSKVLIWDLGGVLFKENHLGFAHKIGIRRFLAYTFVDKKTPFIEPLIFNILETFGTQQEELSQRVCTKRGAHIPSIMCDWFSGKKSSLEILEAVNQRIEELDKERYFISLRQKKLAQEAVRVMFDPHIIGRHMRPIRKGVKLLKECAQVSNEDGTKKHTLFVLSNWDSLSFEVLYERNPQVFSLFDPKHIVISGRIGLVKPHKNCFQYLIDTYKLTPELCVFIDDQEVNVKNAQAFKMTALLVKKGDYKTLRKKLKELQVL